MTVRCRLFGHKWIDLPELKYERGKAYASRMTDDGWSDPELVDFTWVYDEVCARCGIESRWPA